MLARFWCDRCHKRELNCYATWVETARQTMSSPAEHDRWCRRCVREAEHRNDPHEQAAARARSNDFAETGGKDWT